MEQFYDTQQLSNTINNNRLVGSNHGMGKHEGCCRHCGYIGSDVTLSGCGCAWHARCMDLSSLKSPTCPSCNQPNHAALQLHPMSFREIDEAHHHKKKSENSMLLHNSRKRKNDECSDAIALEKQQHSSKENGLRTGRWTCEEMSFVDNLIEKFESGKLPLVDGIKLNDFLANMLKSKQSRLTKKMKNAKLSSRAFRRTSGFIVDRTDAHMFSQSEEAFFDSIQCIEERAEIRFHMQKEWREHFSSFCVTLGQKLDVVSWLGSVEEMDRRAARAQGAARLARRKLMTGHALRNDTQNPNKGVFIDQQQQQQQHQQGFSNNPFNNDSEELLELLNENNELPVIYNPQQQNHAPKTSAVRVQNYNTNSPFLARVMSFMQRHNVPFEHIDAWVPSLIPSSDTPQTDTTNDTSSRRLCFAGCATAYLPSTAEGSSASEEYFNLTAFGEYSQKFSFSLGCGLPGRVYETNIPTWEQGVYNAPLHHFERCGGAKIWGVKTVVGIPVPSPNVGLIVVCLYSCHDREKDQELVGMLCDEFTRLMPSPKWKLVVELGVPNIPVHPSNANNTSITEIPKPSQNVQTATEATITNNENSLINEIISLIGEFMPSDPQSSPSSSPLSAYVPGFISIRLLLLKQPNYWTEQEKEFVEMLLNSYMSYKTAGRSRSDMAVLLARDCMFLLQQQQPQPQGQSPTLLSTSTTTTTTIISPPTTASK